ncbi:MAG: hypothetical protein ACPGJS_05990, partial [Flammeovirgaceae bacterium]
MSILTSVIIFYQTTTDNITYSSNNNGQTRRSNIWTTDLPPLSNDASIVRVTLNVNATNTGAPTNVQVIFNQNMPNGMQPNVGGNQRTLVNTTLGNTPYTGQVDVSNFRGLFSNQTSVFVGTPTFLTPSTPSQGNINMVLVVDYFTPF